MVDSSWVTTSSSCSPRAALGLVVAVTVAVLHAPVAEVGVDQVALAVDQHNYHEGERSQSIRTARSSLDSWTSVLG